LFCSSGDVVAYYQPRMKDLKKEMFRCALLDTKNKIIRDEVVSIGSLTASIVHPRDTFKAATRESAAAVIFIHNHLSGDIKPSQEDIPDPATGPGRRGDRHFLDHIIIGDGSHFSFRDNGLMQRP
jgi:DNA repair protein RadC